MYFIELDLKSPTITTIKKSFYFIILTCLEFIKVSNNFL